MHFELNYELMWVVIGVILFTIEFLLPGLVFFFFGLGALIVAVICFFFNISINTQLIIFIISSILSLLLLRSWFKSIFIGYKNSKQKAEKDIGSFIGEHVTVIEDISPDKTGKVELHGTDWSAESDEVIPVGTRVKIIKQNNLTLKVKKQEIKLCKQER